MIVDEYGFVNEGYYLGVVIPYRKEFFMVEVVERANKGFERIDYGPIQHDEGLGTGVVPPISRFPTTNVWYLTSDPVRGLENLSDSDIEKNIFYNKEKDRLYHMIMEIRPNFLKHLFHCPETLPQTQFATMVAQANSDFGVFHERFEWIWLPKLHIGFATFNDTNLPVITNITLYYAEYEIRPVDAGELPEAIKLSKIVTLPLFRKDDQIEKSLEFLGVEMFGTDMLKERGVGRWVMR